MGQFSVEKSGLPGSLLSGNQQHGRFFPRQTGKNYFRKVLWKNGVDWRNLPQSFISAFVDDAMQYARAASSKAPTQSRPKTKYFVEFQRMLILHSCVVAALLRGEEPETIKATDIFLFLIHDVPLSFKEFEAVLIVEAINYSGEKWERQLNILSKIILD